MMMMIMRHPVALFICAVIGFTIHKTQSDDELELFCAIAAVRALCRRLRDHSGGNSAARDYILYICIAR